MIPGGLQQIFSRIDQHILIIGIGNLFRSDDGAGPRIVGQLKPSNNVTLLNAETNIERYIEPIQRSHSDILLFVDCVHFGKNPGYAEILPIHQIEDHTMHSHNISLKRIRDFFSVPSYVLGIQPKTLIVSENLSPEVSVSVNQIAEEINRLIKLRV